MASRVLGAFVVTGTAVLASLALSTPAWAHTPTVEVNCVGENSVLTVELKNYNTQKGKNSLTVVIDGAEVKKQSFDWGVAKETWTRDSKTKHTFKVTVIASDDPNGFQKNPDWSKEYDLSNETCLPKTPTSSSTSPTPSSPEVPSSSVTPPPSSSTPNAPAPGGSTPEPPLAATGASPMWLLLSGLGLVGAGAGTLLFLRRRRSA